MSDSWDDEGVFVEDVAATMREQSWTDSVRTSVWVHSLDREVDIVVDAGTYRFVIEAEDCLSDTIYNGVGQALLYSGAIGGIPVVIYPAANATASVQAERRIQQMRVPIVGIPQGWDGSLSGLIETQTAPASSE